MIVTFTYKTTEEKKVLQDIIRKEAENRFKFDYQFGVFTGHKIYIYIKNEAYISDIEYGKQQMIKKEFSLPTGNINIRKKYEQDNFISSILNQISFETEITEQE